MTQAKRRRRVLIVEDEPALRLSYQRAFQRKYDLVFASTGAEAMEQLEEHQPDVAVLDMRLPDTDGVELLRRIRLSQPDLPVIITTAYMSIEPQLKVLNLPHSGYIVKPFRLDELGALMLIQRRAAERRQVVVLRNPSEEIRFLLVLTKLYELFQIELGDD